MILARLPPWPPMCYPSKNSGEVRRVKLKRASKTDSVVFPYMAFGRLEIGAKYSYKLCGYFPI